MGFILRFDQLGRDDIALAGGKGANLGELTRAGLPVPPGFVLTTEAYRSFLSSGGLDDQILALAELPPGAEPALYDRASTSIRLLFDSVPLPDEITKQLLAAAQSLGAVPTGAVPPRVVPPFAVRSSATAEDLEGASFAGQQDTYLNVRGSDALLGAVRDCWASLWTARAMAYRGRQGIDPADVALAVVVQQMVPADAAGVMFTANPVNGRREEIVVSAAWGLGESVVSGAVNTDDIVLNKRTRQVLSRTIADKSVMTVYRGLVGDDGPGSGGTEEQPVPTAKRDLPVLDDAAAGALAGLGARIETHFGAPQDIEWAHADGAFWIVQSRPITALPDPESDPPSDWSVPNPKALYVRASIVEQLPDPLSTLFADLVDPSVTRSLMGLMREFLGENVLRDGDIGLPTVNGYAYYRYTMAAFGRIMLRSPAAMRLLSSSGPKSGRVRWRELSHPRYVRIVEKWSARSPADLTDVELMDGVVELLDAGTEYYTAVQTIIPIAASSEIFFTEFYDRLIRRQGDPPAATFLLGYDSTPILAEKSLYDLSTWVRTSKSLTAVLLATPAAEVAALLSAGSSPAGVDPGTWVEWRDRFQAHLDKFGHTVYNLDFVNAVPADDPAPLLETLRFYLGSDRADPYERQRRSAARREAETSRVLARVDTARGTGFSRLLHWAQSNGPVREDALADIGLAWPQLRRMLRELGGRLVTVGVIDSPDDIYWLHREEIDGDRRSSLAAQVADRRTEWRGRRRATPPQLLPQGTLWDRMESLMPAASTQQAGNVLRGTGASAGQVTATARVLAGPEDFGRMKPGDVLVASITTPAWTSLFAMASAVVTDVGGPLSHSSIVAREYGIPAVLGTGLATRRIPDGSRLRVDGDAGTVTLLDVEGTAESISPAPQGESHRARLLIAAGIGAVAVGVLLGVARTRRRSELRRS